MALSSVISLPRPSEAVVTFNPETYAEEEGRVGDGERSSRKERRLRALGERERLCARFDEEETGWFGRERERRRERERERRRTPGLRERVRRREGGGMSRGVMK